jgi:hypothetical protein
MCFHLKGFSGENTTGPALMVAIFCNNLSLVKLLCSDSADLKKEIIVQGKISTYLIYAMTLVDESL